MHTGQKSFALTESIRLLEERNYDAAIKALQQHISEQADGESEALLALAYFHQEAYGLATQHYQAALTYQPDNKDWQEMLALARANSTAEIPVPVPDLYYFERDKLLALPAVPSGALPTLLPPPPAPSLFKRILLVLGNFLVRRQERPSGITTTLYEFMTALQDVVGPDDDALVVATVVHLLRSGRLTLLGTACTRGRRTA